MSLTAPSTTIQNADRFIPNRAATVEYGQNNLTIDKRALTIYQRLLLEALNLHPDHRRVLYFSSNPKPEDSHPYYPRQFHIPRTPSRILDAPNFTKDYYLNTLSTTRSERLVAIALDKVTYVYNYAQQSIMAQLLPVMAPQTVIAWHPSHLQILQADYSQALALVNLGTSRHTAYQFPVEAAALYSADWQDETHFTVGDESGTVYMYDMHQPNTTNSLIADAGKICGMKWSNDHEYLAIGSNANNVKVYDPRNYSRPLYQRAHLAGVKALSWSSDGHSFLFSGGGVGDCRIIWHDILRGEIRDEIPTGSQVCQLECLDSGHLVSSQGYSALPNQNVILWERRSGDGATFQKKDFLPGQAGRILSLSSMKNQDGFTICGASSGETLAFWELRYRDFPKELKTSLKKEVSILVMPQIR